MARSNRYNTLCVLFSEAESGAVNPRLLDSLYPPDTSGVDGVHD